MKDYIKNKVQPMIEWTKDYNMKDVSISAADKKNGSPKKGDMIAINPDNPEDKWLVAKDFFEYNYIAVEDSFEEVVTKQTEKILTNTTAKEAKTQTRDIEFWGNGDTFLLISKASSQSAGWMKSTKAMPYSGGVVVQVTTQQRNPDGSYSVAEALTNLPGAVVMETIKLESGREYEMQYGEDLQEKSTLINRFIK